MLDDLVLELRDQRKYAPAREANAAAKSAGLEIDLAGELERIPNKMGFKIGEVAELLNVKTHVLRFWESEFPNLSPQKAVNNQRIYTRKDVEVAVTIKHLLYNERYSIEGARSALKRVRSEARKAQAVAGTANALVTLRAKSAKLLTAVQNLRRATA